MQSKQETDGTSGPARRWRRWALAGLSAAMLLTGGPAIAGDAALLKDLERERAALLDALLDPERTVVERERYVRAAARRLADMERMARTPEREVGAGRSPHSISNKGDGR